MRIEYVTARLHLLWGMFATAYLKGKSRCMKPQHASAVR